MKSCCLVITSIPPTQGVSIASGIVVDLEAWRAFPGRGDLKQTLRWLRRYAPRHDQVGVCHLQTSLPEDVLEKRMLDLISIQAKHVRKVI